MSRAHVRATLVSSLIAILVACPAVTWARPVDPRELEARRDFAEARYEDALHIFAALFSEMGDPIYLRNLARCYQKLKRPAEAIAAFKDYLVKGNLAPGERAEIESYIAEMRALQASERSPADVPGGHQTKPLGSATADASSARVPAAAPAPAAFPAAPAVAAEPGNGRLLRITGLAAGATGVVLLGVGVGYGMAARSAQREVEYQYDASRDANGSHYERLQWIAYAAGGVALATGVGLVIASLRGSEPTERSTSHALLSPGGLGWEGTF